MSIGSPDVSEILASAGLDFLIYDTEHSPLGLESIAHMMAAAGPDVTSVIRVAWNDHVLIKRALDIGAHCLLIPWVNNREEAEKAVKACRYPPKGIRGVAPRRASRYGLDYKEYLATADREVMAIVQIETVEAVRNVESILSVEGVDAYFVGPSDLSASMGLLGQPEAPLVLEAIEKVLEAGRRVKLPGGVQPANIDAANRWISKGFQIVPLGADSFILMNAVRDLVGKVKRPD